MSRAALNALPARAPLSAALASAPSQYRLLASRSAKLSAAKQATRSTITRRHHASLTGAGFDNGWSHGFGNGWGAGWGPPPPEDQHHHSGRGWSQWLSRMHDRWNVDDGFHKYLLGNPRLPDASPANADWTSRWAAKASTEWVREWAMSRNKLDHASRHDPNFRFELRWSDAINLFVAFHRARKELALALKANFSARHYHPWQSGTVQPRHHRGPWTWDRRANEQQQQQQSDSPFCARSMSHRLFGTLPTYVRSSGETLHAFKRKLVVRPPSGGPPRRGFSSGPSSGFKALIVGALAGRFVFDCTGAVMACADTDSERRKQKQVVGVMRFESEQAAATRPQKHIHLSLTARTPTIRQPSEVELELAPPQRKWACVCMKIPCNFLSWRLARFVSWVLGFFKTSNSLSVIHTVTRIVMTLVPMTLIKLRFMSAVLKKLPDDPRVIAHKDSFLRNIKCTKKSLLVMVAIPFALFWTTILSSLERTPLTGRPRLILLSPSEEDDVAKQLQGPGWYSAVADILVNNAEGDVPRVISTTDWRYIWVHDTLRKLETYMHILAHEKEHFQHLVDTAPPGFPVPPPSSYPLAPRPRVSQIVHCFLTETFSRNTPAEPPPALGPPYNLLLVEKPDTSNGFSYGFGAGSAGIVVFSGFLDEILRGSQSPTPEQTAQLAILLAHEISHLILSHHLETLSSSTIFAPNMYNIFSDVVRTLLFPITMMFGPFVNDAVANMTRVTQSELLQGHESCFNRRLEIEADLVSIRILAYAGFDPRLAIHFWESRLDNDHEDLHNHNHNTRAPSGNFMRGDTHPVREERLLRLKQELARWRRIQPRAIVAANG